ncbi:hypothetical protein [Providencia rettgeri]|uniref:hypothetical protein n=1 Tax=Providencia rettgeri TaxID=587 RepID=UPI0030181E57
MTSYTLSVFDILSIVASFGVFFDASYHHIGVYRNRLNHLKGHSPLFWGLVTLLFWVFFLPLYLFRRKKLLVAAQLYPVKKSPNVGFLVMVAASLLLMWYIHVR